MMKYLFLIWCGLFPFLHVTSVLETATVSKGKQQNYFPLELKKKGIHLGMTIEKLQKKCEGVQKSAVASEFKIAFSEPSETNRILSYTYLFTKTDPPLLYQISSRYASMEGGHDRAIVPLGDPNHQGEWRIDATTIKEDFTRGYGLLVKNGCLAGDLQEANGKKDFLIKT